jgi:hypothetical protein
VELKKKGGNMIKKFLFLVLTLFLNTALFAIKNDLIFILDDSAAMKQGHIAILVGNEKTGWEYVSINGTGLIPTPWGVNTNPDIGTVITDIFGHKIHGLKRAIRRACEINPKEKHRYHKYKRVKTNEKEDSIALNAARNTASAFLYGIMGPGQSCIDVAQNAFSSLVKFRKLDKKGSVPGQSDWIPKKWFHKIDKRIKFANRRSKNGNQIIADANNNGEISTDN